LPGAPAWLQGKAFCHLIGHGWLTAGEPLTRQELSQTSRSQDPPGAAKRPHLRNVYQGDWWKSDRYKMSGAKLTTAD